MKIRSGFVSNSSSSSFIVAFDEEPKSVDHVKQMLFPRIQTIEYYEQTHTVESIATSVYQDIESGNATRINKRKAFDVVQEGSFAGCPPYNFNRKKASDIFEREYELRTGKRLYDSNDNSEEHVRAKKEHDRLERAEWKQRETLVKTAAKGYLEGFWPQMKGKKVYRFEYADDSGQGHLEHGDIFRNVPHVQISKH